MKLEAEALDYKTHPKQYHNGGLQVSTISTSGKGECREKNITFIEYAALDCAKW